MRKNRVLPSLIALWLAIIACNLPAGGPATEEPSGKETETPTPTFTGIAPVSETPTHTPTPTPVATTCTPTVATNTVANVRSGPGQVYTVVGNIPQGGTAKVLGKNSDGTWWYIEFAGGEGGHAWIAGSVTNATCIPDTLPIIAAPPTPIPPTPTPTSTFVPTSTPTQIPTGGGIILVPPILIFPTPTPTFHLIFPLPIVPVGP
jgi:hypothetical protein